MKLFVALSLLIAQTLHAQCDRWQQAVAYKMDIDFNVKKHQFKGTQELDYTNNSPDTLTRLFYHLYFNAFQPGSAMDVRSRTIVDPDGRIGDRISKYGKDEIGYQKIISLKQDGVPVNFEEEETILEVRLAKPIMPKQTVKLSMEFEAQVPLQTRRSGRDSKEGIDYSMSQWYPKLCKYDQNGWHANPYIAREFYGNFGSFDVSINIDKDYKVAGSGYADNYDGTFIGGSEKKRWHFIADKVHDFMWAADRDYIHKTINISNDLTVHLYYQAEEKFLEGWEKLPPYMTKVFEYANKHYGKYPYKTFSVIQGGDGGMEYPMSTLITGRRSLASLVGVIAHEMMHSWYQGVLGIDESHYPWMDEGFTTYASNNIVAAVLNPAPGVDPQDDDYKGYFDLVKSGNQEPLITHADHYKTNMAYGVNAYGKGAIFLHQLSYVIGQKALDKGLLEFFRDWQFKHPDADDCVRSFERASGMELDWYKEYWVNTTNTINYGIKSVDKKQGKYSVQLERIGYMPMPIDLVITYKDGKTETINIPLPFMRGTKPNEFPSRPYSLEEPWQWPDMIYTLSFKASGHPVRIEIDPSKRMADTDRGNNVYEFETN